MHYSSEYKKYKFIGFWCDIVAEFVNKLKKTKTTSHATHHELGLRFINQNLFNNLGKFDKRKRERDSRYFDLKIPSDDPNKPYLSIEYKLYSNVLKNLNRILWRRKEIFKENDYIYYSYFLRRGFKVKPKNLNDKSCIYYLVIIIFSKKIEEIDLKELLDEIKKDSKEFHDQLAEESGIDLDEEELFGVDNMIKAADLERELEEKEKKYIKIIEDKDKIIEDKEKEIKKLKEQLKKK